MFTRHQGKTRCCRSSGISWPSFFVQVRTVRTYLGSFSRSFCSSKRAMMFDRRSSVGFGTIFGIVVNVRDLRALMFSPALIEETTFMTPFRTVETQTACIATVRALPRMQCWFASPVCQPLREPFLDNPAQFSITIADVRSSCPQAEGRVGSFETVCHYTQRPNPTGAKLRLARHDRSAERATSWLSQVRQMKRPPSIIKSSSLCYFPALAGRGSVGSVLMYSLRRKQD